MKSDHVVIRRTDAERGYYTVESEGKISNFLCWGEMVEQVISLTHPDIKHHRYHAVTVPEQESEDARRAETFREAPRDPMEDAIETGEAYSRGFEDGVRSMGPTVIEPAPERPALDQCGKNSECVHPNGHDSPCTILPF